MGYLVNHSTVTHLHIELDAEVIVDLIINHHFSKSQPFRCNFWLQALLDSFQVSRLFIFLQVNTTYDILAIIQNLNYEQLANST